MTSSAAGEDVLGAAVRQLADLPGVQVELERPRGSDTSTDGVLRVSTPAGTDAYALIIERRLSQSTTSTLLAHLRERARGTRHPLVIVAEHVAPAVAEQLISEHQAFLDAAGNAFLSGDAMYVLRQGRSRRKQPGPARDAFTPVGLQVVFALLRDRALRESTYREVAEAACVSLGSVSLTLRALVSDGYLARSGKGLRVLDFDELLARWELGYAERLRAKLEVQRFDLPRGRTLEQLVRTLAASPTTPVLLGGELGACKLTGHLRAESAAIYSASPARELMLTLRLKPAPDGRIIACEPLASDPGVPHPSGCLLADPILIRAELLALGTERLREVAEQILVEHIRRRETR